ncbi:MAG: glycoside hydrolase family 38 N-terminal domain-containing protein [Eubacteriales bacterium]
MATLAQKYSALKKAVGGNREMMGYEETFGMPREEQSHITMPNKFIRRILAELEFAIRLSGVNDGKFDSDIGIALDYLELAIAEEGVLTRTACFEAEKMLINLAEAAKEYKLILAGHAHIDMNWMWSWHETVAATLATFRTMLNIMDEYPDFCFSQSQASVYKIVEDFEPEMMQRIKQRKNEGRWEITASAWVETDKNMPNTESMIRHIQYAKNYLRDSWDIDPATLEVDFSPDTFGHSANLPEINNLGGVKYYYHCRALDGNQALYRWKGPSGKEVLVYREQYWYNSAITPKIGAGIIDISKRCAGFKTGLIVYGVGDHGGGPTRRDVERAIEMMEWPIYPKIKFGTFHEFFHEAESVRESLPLVEKELNFIFNGCYTTQSRIKMGNRACERALTNAEAMGAFAAVKANAANNNFPLEKAWRDVLFTHFHDILTGSCVQDSREHAMGLYSNSLAVAQSKYASAMLKISEQINTSTIVADNDIASSQSEGAGAGYGVENYSGMPRSERGHGKTRIFNVFNATGVDKAEPVEITVWDWTGDMRFVDVADASGVPVEFQMLDGGLQQYWDHKFFRFLAYVTVPAFGYTTVVLGEKPMQGDYPIYYQGDGRTHHENNNYILENEHIRAEFDFRTGEMISLSDVKTGTQYLKAGERAGLRLIETEAASSNAWNIGNYLRINNVNNAVRIHGESHGSLRRGFVAEYKVLGSTVKLHCSIEKNARAVTFLADVDWREIGGAVIPVLTYEVPLAAKPEKYMYDIPAGVIERKPFEHDVPGLQYAMAVNPDETSSAAIVTESKYGYRGTADGKLIATFINTSTSPDPYPERGIHKINFAVGLFPHSAQYMENAATSINNRLTYQPTDSHKGILAPSGALFGFESDGSVISAVSAEGSDVTVRLYSVTKQESGCTLTFDETIASACFTDIMGDKIEGDITVSDGITSFKMAPFTVANVKLTF